jgi:Flp pilus assembly protein TadD
VLEAMAEVHLLKRDFDTALDLYNGLVREFEDSPKLWNERGVCLHQDGRREASRASYEKAVAIDPDYALAWNNLGVLLADTQGEEAITAFNKAIQSNRQVVDARLNLALSSGFIFIRRHPLRPHGPAMFGPGVSPRLHV